jgi:hypothetical protein
MSIVEENIPYFEHQPVSFQNDVPAMEWFSPWVLSATNSHPLDATIQFTATNRSFFVRWFDRNAEPRPDASTASVTSLVPHEGHLTDVQTSTAPTDDRRVKGIQLHRWIECILNGLPMTTETRLQQQVAAYYKTALQGRLIPWRTEMAIRSSSEIRLVGIIDALFYETGTPTPNTGTLCLHLKDWKYSADVTPAMSEYTQQLNLYKYILESQYTGMTFYVDGLPYQHLRVATMELVVFHESLQTYHCINIPDTQAAVQIQMQARKKMCKMNF